MEKELNSVLLQNLKRIKRGLLGSLNLANAQIQGIPIFWLVGVWGSYALVGLYQTGGEVILIKTEEPDAETLIWITRIFWVLFLTGWGPFLGAATKKEDSIVASVAGGVAVAVGLAGAGAVAGNGAVAGAVALSWAVGWAWGLAGDWTVGLALVGVMAWAVVGVMAWAVVWVWAVAVAVVGAWAWAGALALGLAVVGVMAAAWGEVTFAVAFAVVWAWGFAWGVASALSEAGAWGLAGAWARAWAEAWAGAGAYFGTQLWISIVSYLWAIRHPENNIRWLSWLMAILSLLIGGFCFYQANQNGEDILPGVILGTAVMGIIALVVATLVGAGKRLRAAGLGYWQRWFWLAVPAVLGVVVGWRSYGVFPWAGE